MGESKLRETFDDRDVTVDFAKIPFGIVKFGLVTAIAGAGC